ncbi:MAG: ribonuclease III domain-containing protein [Saccharofermentanales bacterium]|jgi:ribonuclease-3 family protein
MDNLSDKELLSYSVSTLAWVGDAVFELHIRSRLAKRVTSPSGKLHHIATSFVSARGQASLFETLYDDRNDFPLSEQETNLLRRARNYHCHSTPKDADLADYRRATALEALIGWLWLNGQHARAGELIEYVLRQSGMAERLEFDSQNRNSNGES